MKISFKILKLLILLPICTSHTTVTYARNETTLETKKNLSYADIADLADASPIIAISRVQGIKNVELAVPESPAGKVKYRLITSKIESLIRGKEGISSKVSFLVQKPANVNDPTMLQSVDWRRGLNVLIFAKPGARPNTLQLVSRNAAQRWSPEIEAITRSVTTELLGASPPPRVIGIGDAFHVTGSVKGESETQIFLKTDSGNPVSISILHRPGEAARWGVSLGEIVDDAAIPPASGTLLWYRLACSLPSTLPFTSISNLTVLDAEAARRDYRFVMESLGSCGRTL